jgi:hypothetical protein
MTTGTALMILSGVAMGYAFTATNPGEKMIGGFVSVAMAAIWAAVQ